MTSPVWTRITLWRTQLGPIPVSAFLLGKQKTISPGHSDPESPAEGMGHALTELTSREHPKRLAGDSV